MTRALAAFIASTVVLAASAFLPWLTVTGTSATFRASLLYSRLALLFPGIALLLILLALLFAWRRWAWTVVLMRSLSLSAIIAIVPVVGYYRQLTISARSLELRAGSLRGLIGDPQGAELAYAPWVAAASAAACYFFVRKLPTRRWVAWPLAVPLAALWILGVGEPPGRIQPNASIAARPFLASIAGMQTRGFIERTEALAAERMAPDFSLKTPSGGDVTLAEFRGKHVVLNFWATWCAPCMYEMPLLEQLYQRQRNGDAVVLAVSVDDERDKVSPFMAKLNLSFPALFSTIDVEKAYGVTAYPTTFVVSPTGRIELTVVGTLSADQIRTIEKLVSDP